MCTSFHVGNEVACWKSHSWSKDNSKCLLKWFAHDIHGTQLHLHFQLHSIKVFHPRFMKITFKFITKEKISKTKFPLKFSQNFLEIEQEFPTTLQPSLWLCNGPESQPQEDVIGTFKIVR